MGTPISIWLEDKGLSSIQDRLTELGILVLGELDFLKEEFDGDFDDDIVAFRATLNFGEKKRLKKALDEFDEVSTLQEYETKLAQRVERRAAQRERERERPIDRIMRERREWREQRERSAQRKQEERKEREREAQRKQEERKEREQRERAAQRKREERKWRGERLGSNFS